MAKLPFISGIILIFAAGLVSGFFLGSQSSQQANVQGDETRNTAPPDEQASLEHRIIGWMYDYLEINASQETEIRPLVKRAIKEYRQLETQHREAIHALIDQSDQRIAEHLTDAQAEKLFAHSRSNR